jgi:hypothetical protein
MEEREGGTGALPPLALLTSFVGEMSWHVEDADEVFEDVDVVVDVEALSLRADDSTFLEGQADADTARS